MEFFHSSSDVISREVAYQFLKNRVSFDKVFPKIKNLVSTDKEIFKSFWDQRINAEYAENVFQLGVNHVNKKNLIEAIEKFKEAVKLNSSFVLAHYFLGASLAAARDFKQAENHFIL